MKIIYFVILLVAVLGLQSCGMVRIRYVDTQTGQPIGQQQGYGQQGGQFGPGGRQLQGGQQQRSLKPYYPGQKPDGRMVIGQKRVQTGTKKELNHHVQAVIWSTDDQSQKNEIAQYALDELKAGRGIPSDADLSAKYHVKAHAYVVK
ncbi:hypothetical protein H7Y21_02615 [Arenimonas sp.]|nr:hypothetical protein [Candidatus Parcubacteria bacterium]